MCVINVFYRSQKVIQIWNNIAVNKWWLNFYFCVIYAIKTEKRGTSLIIQQPTIKSQCSVNECSETNWHMRRMPLVKGQCERLMLAVWSENRIKSSHKCMQEIHTHAHNPEMHAKDPQGDTKMHAIDPHSQTQFFFSFVVYSLCLFNVGETTISANNTNNRKCFIYSDSWWTGVRPISWTEQWLYDWFPILMRLFCFCTYRLYLLYALKTT